MDDTTGTQTCGLCHKEVAEANFALHETHCRRFLCLCPDCGEAVPKEQLDQHREEEHTQTRCSKCSQKMERCRLKDHEAEECVERLQACQFCDLELSWKKLQEHSVACGSRTELCRDCNRYVKLIDQQEHASSCSTAEDNASRPPPPPPPASSPTNGKKATVICSACMTLFPAEDIEEHELECFSVSSWDYPGKKEGGEEEEFPGQVTTPNPSSIYSGASLSHTASSNGPGGDPDQIGLCPHCRLTLPLFTLHKHQAKCQIYKHLK